MAEVMFQENKYRRWYVALTGRAADRAHHVGMERHHILPRSLGGTNARSNIVSLTYREHFLAHWLLTKCTTGTARLSMLRALACMTWIAKTHTRLIAGWQYAIARSVLPELGRALGTSGKGRAHTSEHAQRIADALRGKPKSEEHRAKLAGVSRTAEEKEHLRRLFKGRTYSEQTLARMREASTGRTHSEATRAKLSKALSGREITAEWRGKIGAALKGRKLGPQSPEHRAKLAKAAAKRVRGPNGCFGR